ncbi:P-loop containing nucleoside triphosphate hydrolase protein [Clohesyomyces aquaticus]|uniref:ATP-dependent RNA helicase n=1 Tax=Clohesyomyces aquaticus TaxID=1231657 RepID=A0A1Y1YEY4_9PLEO|nr:P-loop containing nucleoside triphosphate hydrolase protein [Clohesyomyces aquaticus]
MKFPSTTVHLRSLQQCPASSPFSLLAASRVCNQLTLPLCARYSTCYAMSHAPKRGGFRGNRGRHPHRPNRNGANLSTQAAAAAFDQPMIAQEALPLSAVPQNVQDMPKRSFSDMAGGEVKLGKPYSSMAGQLDKALLEGLTKMGFEYMTPVQEKVLSELPTLSSDCLVQAKTGTGKTAAFLLPAIQNLLKGNMPARGRVGILVLCPTRELALQIAKECDGITACLPRRMECHTAFGGTARASTLNKFLRGDPTILVATPGRLDDILGEEQVRDRFQSIQTVVLDEADRMLDQGFAPQINSILRRIPPKRDGWQGMCFSATLPERVNDVVKCVLFPGYTSLSTIDRNEAPTLDKVPQFAITVPSIQQIFSALYALIQHEYEQDPKDFKAIVFGTTANGVGLLYDVFKVLLPQFQIFELHSRLSQSTRTSTTNRFKDATSGILFASDVVGRGMDFPNVGLVIQLGLPSATEQYIHRVGRTARAGKDGRAVMVLFENEAFFVHTNKTLPIKPYPFDISATLNQHYPTIEKAFTRVDEESKAKAYQAFLGYNKTYLKKLRLDTKGLVQLANQYAESMGCPEPPLIEKRTVGKMGLKGVPGLRIGSRRED